MKRTSAFYIIKNVMENYKNLKYNQSIEIETDVNDPVVINELLKAQAKTKYVLATLSKTMSDIQHEYKTEGKEIYFFVFSQHYIIGKSYESIAEEKNISERTARKYTAEILQSIAIKMFGIDALDIGGGSYAEDMQDVSQDI